MVSVLKIRSLSDSDRLCQKHYQYKALGFIYLFHLFIFSLTLSECMELVQYTITSVYKCKRVGTIQFYSVVQLIFVHHHSLAAVRCVQQHHTVFWTLPRLPSSSRPLNLYYRNLALHSVHLQRPGGWQYSCFFYTINHQFSQPNVAFFLNIQLRNQVKNSRCQPFYRFAVTVKCCTFLPVVLITSATNNLPTKATIKIHTFIFSDTLNMHSYHWPGVTWIHGQCCRLGIFTHH